MPGSSVTGTDGISPFANGSARWQIWELADVYVGQAGNGKYVVRIGDYIIDKATYTTYEVTAVDPTTLVPTYSIKNLANTSYSLSNADVLFGVGPGTPSDSYLVYIDTSVTPHTLAVDVRLKVNSSLANYARIFKGSDLSGTGQVISQVFDSSGNLLTDHVPLEIVGIDNFTNYAIKSVAVCNCTISMVDADVVTVVIYANDGTVLSKRQCLVWNTSFIRTLNTSQKYVAGINLLTPFISTTPNTINMPINLPLNSLNLQGEVMYSDGSTSILPVDGTKFRIFGLDQFIASRVGQNFPIALNYIMGSTEVGYGVTSNGTLSVDGKTFNAAYNLVTVDTNGSYNVKLFGYPVWLGTSLGYTMYWFLFNLDRNVWFNVTSLVNYSLNTGAFNPKAYGIVQNKDITINLSDVSGTFRPFVYSQMVNIALMIAPNGNNTPWTMMNDNTPGLNPYGVGLHATTASLIVNSLNISSGFTTLSTWLNAVYYNTYPIVNMSTELAPPIPTHFQILQFDNVGMHTTEFTIDQYINSNLSVAIQPHQYDTVFLKFINRTSGGDLQLSIAAMLVGSIT